MNQKSEEEYFGRDLEAMSFAQNYHHWILEEISPYLGGDVAEVGAGKGNFSNFLLTANINKLVAFEPSANMYSLLEKDFRDNHKVKTVNAFLEDRLPDFSHTFDSVCYINVLEHIKDHKKALSHAHKTLKHNGHLIIFVPALSFLYSDFDKKVGHHRRYSKTNLVDLVTSEGFSISKVQYFDMAGIIPWYLSFVLLKNSVNKTNVSMYDKLVVPAMKKVERIVPPIIGKNLILVGKK